MESASAGLQSGLATFVGAAVIVIGSVVSLAGLTLFSIGMSNRGVGGLTLQLTF